MMIDRILPHPGPVCPLPPKNGNGGIVPPWLRPCPRDPFVILPVPGPLDAAVGVDNLS